MSLSDDWRRLVAAPPPSDTAEEARLAALFQNRSELKKELKALDDERHRLLDRLKLQEGSTMRVEEQLASLEQYLGRPEEGQKSLAYFQLRAVWRSASRRLEQFAAELARQQKDRERRQQLADFERNKRNRLDDVDREVYEARILVDRRGRAAARRGRLRPARILELLSVSAHGTSSRRAIRGPTLRAPHLDRSRRPASRLESETPQTFEGMTEGRRAVNLAVIACAEALCERLAPANPRSRSPEATLTRVYDADFGGVGAVRRADQATTRALGDLESDCRTTWRTSSAASTA